jgi:altered-inheritance-of-mitochondria protein 13
MGQADSKPQQEAGVTFQTSSIPIQFSPNLVNHLDAQSESDLSRAASLEQHIQDRVKQELQKLRSREREALAAATQKYAEENIKKEKGKSGLNSVILEQDIEALKKKLEKRPSLGDEDKSVSAKREAVISCLKAHPGQSLDCDAEVTAFKESVAQLQRKFVERYN